MDLPRLSKVIQDFGGMQNVIDKKKWNKVADILRIPKLVSFMTGVGSSQLKCSYKYVTYSA